MNKKDLKKRLSASISYLKPLLSQTEELEHIQFLAVFILLSIVSAVMSIMNYFTKWELLMWSTIAFTGFNAINFLLTLKRGTWEKVARVLFAFEIIGLFTFFLIMGEPEGFSALWISLLPACGLILYHGKNGSLISFAQLLILIFLLYTPIGRSLLQYPYTESFMMRYPVLYISFYLVSLFFELVRAGTQKELIIAKEKYEFLYTDEKINAEKEKERNFEIIKVLASEYSSVYYLNLKDDTFEPYTMNETVSSEFGDIFRSDISYTDAFKMFVDSFVFEEDKELMLKAGSLNEVVNNLLESTSYITTYRSDNEDHPHYCEMKFVRMVGTEGAPEYAALGFMDKDAQIRKEQEYQQTLKDARDKAEAASEAKTKFLFNMSHDIRTPMNAIIGFTDMANKYLENPEKARDYIEKVRVSSNHLLELINNVLDMSRIESGKVEIETSLNNIDEYIHAIDAIISTSAKEKQLTFSIVKENITKENLFVDTLHLNQILLNLIGNSIKYTKPNGDVKLIIRERNIDKEGFIGIDFIVQDTGIGMSKEYLEHIFEAFTREFNTTASGIQGTGLGMSITKRLVDLMGGTINIESELGVGTTTTVSMDFKVYELEIEKQKCAGQEEEEEEEVILEGKRLLLVDDNDLNREIAKDILEEVGIIIEEANDGSIAVEMVQKNDPNYYDFVLMDIQMPYMDGYKATRVIRTLTNADYSNLPIIAMTANAFEEDRKNAFEAGMDEHLAKPIDIIKTMETLRKFVKK